MGIFKTSDMFRFKYMRNLFIDKWNLMASFEFETKSMGTPDSPFDLTELGISL